MKKMGIPCNAAFVIFPVYALLIFSVLFFQPAEASASAAITVRINDLPTGTAIMGESDISTVAGGYLRFQCGGLGGVFSSPNTVSDTFLDSVAGGEYIQVGFNLPMGYVINSLSFDARGFNNPNPADGDQISIVVLDPTTGSSLGYYQPNIAAGSAISEAFTAAEDASIALLYISTTAPGRLTISNITYTYMPPDL